MINKFLDFILFLLIILIPLHMVMVDYLGLVPGIWKEFLLVLLVLLWFTKGIMDRKLAIKKTKVNLALCLFIFWGIFLLAVDINNFERNIIGLRNLLQYSLVFLLAVNIIKDKSWLKKYILLISIIGVAIATLNSYLYIFKEELFVDINRAIAPGYPPLSITRLGRMAPLLFMGAEYYAYYMAVIACLLMGFLLFARSKLLKLLLIIGIGSVVLSLLLTHTRAGVVAFFVAILFYGFRYNKKLLVVLVIATLVIAMVLPPDMHKRYITELFGGSLSLRLYIIRDVFLVGLTSPIWGIGLGNVGAANPAYTRISSPHNYYAALLLQTGFIGLMLYLSILWIFLKTSINVFKRIEGGYFKGLMAGMIMFFIAFSIIAFFGGDEGYLIAPFYWLFGGFVMILSNDIRRRQG